MFGGVPSISSEVLAWTSLNIHLRSSHSNWDLFKEIEITKINLYCTNPMGQLSNTSGDLYIYVCVLIVLVQLQSFNINSQLIDNLKSLSD